MDFFGIIFYIIIIAIFVKAKKVAQSGGEQKRTANHQGKYSAQRTILNAPKKGTGTIPNVPKKGNNTIPNIPKNGKIITPNVPVKKKEEKVFLEPHKEESRQPRIRNNNLWGEDEHAHQRIVALRLMEGDAVPEGYVKIRCPYCAADNLVTKHCRQYHSCYFCRVPID